MRRIGHIGTLDPMADGLLALCLGPATRIVPYLVGLDQVYEGTLTLGGISSTYDAEGEIVTQDRPLPAAPEALVEAMRAQLGEQVQLPPPYSAVKVRGKKLYEYARAGEPVPEKPRTVHVHRFELTRWASPEADFVAKVGSGTYIRSMAHNLGIALGCGAYLSALRRTRIGGFPIEGAATLDQLDQEPDLIGLRLLGITEALSHLPKLIVHPRMRAKLLNGQSFTTRDVLEFDGILSLGRPALALDADGAALSIVQPQRAEADGEESDAEMAMGAAPMLFKPMRVLARS
jgi:tRNA pseudouridine55 synthase